MRSFSQTNVLLFYYKTIYAPKSNFHHLEWFRGPVDKSSQKNFLNIFSTHKIGQFHNLGVYT